MWTCFSLAGRALALGLLLAFAGNAQAAVAPQAVDGRIDLSDWDFDRDGPVVLAGNWHFHWRSLDAPGQAPVGPGAESLIRVPWPWMTARRDGVDLPAQGFGTYRLRVTLPDGGPPLGLRAGSQHGGFRLYADGRPILSLGEVGETAETSSRYNISYRTVVALPRPAASREIELVLQVSNFVMPIGGATAPILVGSEEDLRRAQDLERGVAWAVMGAVVLIGLTNLGLFARRSADAALAWFGLLTLACALRNATAGENLMLLVFPAMDRELLLKFGYLGFAGGLACALLFVRALYPRDGSRSLALVGVALSAFYSALVVVTDYAVYRQLAFSFQLVALAAVAYFLAAYVTAALRRRPGALAGLIAAGCAGVTAANDLLLAAGFYAGKALFPFGFLLFLMVQTAVLAMRFGSAYARAEDLSHRLAGQNQELENQVAARTRALQEKAQALEAANRDLKRADEVKDRLLSAVSHELRTPLTSIRGALGLIQAGVAGLLPDKAKALVGTAVSNSDRLARLINDLLEVEAIRAGSLTVERQPVDLAALLARAVADNAGFAERYGVIFALSGSGAKALVLGEERRLLQLLDHLLSNAAKFSPRGAEVAVRLLRPDDGHWRIEVADRGPGIPDDFRTRLFRPFEQVDTALSRSDQRGGTGVGLAIAKAIVDGLQGTIGYDTECDPAKGTGTVFRVALPAVPEPAPAEEGVVLHG